MRTNSVALTVIAVVSCMPPIVDQTAANRFTASFASSAPAIAASAAKEQRKQ
jgi:hypothetical protein